MSCRFKCRIRAASLVHRMSCRTKFVVVKGGAHELTESNAGIGAESLVHRMLTNQVHRKNDLGSNRVSCRIKFASDCVRGRCCRPWSDPTAGNQVHRARPPPRARATIQLNLFTQRPTPLPTPLAAHDAARREPAPSKSFPS